MSGGSGITREAASLTHRTIEAMRPSEAPYRIPDLRCAGLAVRVAASGLKTWDLAYRIYGIGQTRRVSLGHVSDVSLEQARQRASELTGAARAGRDLLAEELKRRIDEQSRVTVGRLIEIYVRRRVAGRLRTAKEIESRLFRTLQPILSRHADEVRRRDIRELLDRAADDGIEREAEKRRQTTGAMFRWALSQDLVETNPTAGLSAYDPGTPRNRVLSAGEVSTLWKWLDSGDLPAERSTVLKLQLLTGARCGEISGLQAEEIDCAQWVWTLPASRSKNKRPRVTPLVGTARQILEASLTQISKGALFQAESGVVLTSAHVGRSLWIRRDRLPLSNFCTHDLRRTVSTFLVEMGVALETVAAVLGHETGGKEVRTLIRHYVRTDLVDRKTAALVLWDRRLNEIVSNPS